MKLDGQGRRVHTLLCCLFATATAHLQHTPQQSNTGGVGVDVHLANDSKVFTAIYRTHHWGKGSGPGSTQRNTKKYRALLQAFFDDPKYKRIIDYGCGDFRVMKSIQIPDNKTYVGVDVVQHVIDQNNALYAKRNVKFHKVSDFTDVGTSTDFRLAGDLLIVKDVMIHWPNAKIQDFMDRVLPNFKYALITNDVFLRRRTRNRDIRLGGFRPVDIAQPPFNFNVSNIRTVLEWVGPADGKPKRSYFYTNPCKA